MKASYVCLQDLLICFAIWFVVLFFFHLLQERENRFLKNIYDDAVPEASASSQRAEIIANIDEDADPIVVNNAEGDLKINVSNQENLNLFIASLLTNKTLSMTQNEYHWSNDMPGNCRAKTSLCSGCMNAGMKDAKAEAE